MVTERQVLLYRAYSIGIYANLCCVPGHIGIAGNKNVEASGNSAATGDDR